MIEEVIVEVDGQFQELAIIKETEKAILLDTAPVNIWCPKSQIKESKNHKWRVLSIPKWLFLKNLPLECLNGYADAEDISLDQYGKETTPKKEGDVK